MVESGQKQKIVSSWNLQQQEHPLQDKCQNPNHTLRTVQQVPEIR
jgi:hypothetical protein